MSRVSTIRRPHSGIYTVRDAALYLRATTPPPEVPLKVWQRRRKEFIGPTSRHLYAWVRRSLDSSELSHLPREDLVLNFTDLVRLRMIVIMRSRGLPLSLIRHSEEYARQLTGNSQPFVTEMFWTNLSDIFLKWREFLVAASKKGQLAMDFLEDYLMPVNHGLAFSPDERAEAWVPYEGVLIDPEIQFGAPCIAGTRIQTEAVWAFHEAGEPVQTLAEMYQVDKRRIESAIEWEKTLERAA